MLSSNTSKYLRAQDIAIRLGIGKSTWYAWLHTRTDMPQPIKLSSRCVVWDLEDIENFIKSNRTFAEGKNNE